MGHRNIGGVDQWMMIRGGDLANPPLVLLHGGPGFSETHFFLRFNTPLEKHFTVVYWDQRGSGKSFSRKIPTSSMTVERFIADLDELIEIVRGRTGHEKVAIYGHSWGTALGILHAKRFPQKVSVYVGSGQIGDWQASERATYAYTLAEAERRGKSKAIRELKAIGPPPHNAKALWTQRMWLNRLEGMINPRVLLDLGRMFIGRSELSVLDLVPLFRGFRFSLDAMWNEVSRINLLDAAPTLEVPIFFFLGRRDHWVPPETSAAYFDVLTAPAKRIVWFDDSGHEPFVDEPAKFNALMSELVRPLAV